MTVRHWRFESGQADSETNKFLASCLLEPLPRGWYCHVSSHDPGFVAWVQEHCPGAELQPRHGNGDAYWAIYFQDESEAVTFGLRWS